MPSRRIKLALQDLYSYGAHRGGIDERWFASTSPAANENHEIDVGYSYVVANDERALLLKFASHEAATQGVTFENTGLEPLVTLRYFGPPTNPHGPEVGNYKKKKC